MKGVHSGQAGRGLGLEAHRETQPEPEPTVPKTQYDEAMAKVAKQAQEIEQLRRSHGMLETTIRVLRVSPL